MVVFNQQVIDTGLEPKFTSKVDDFFPHPFNHSDELECPDMGFADVKDFFWCACLDEFFQNFAAVVLGIAYLGMQFPVRKSTSAAFSELHVRFRVEFTVTPKTEGVLRALTYLFAALNDDGLEPALGKD